MYIEELSSCVNMPIISNGFSLGVKVAFNLFIKPGKILTLPFMFSNAPTSAPSDLLTPIFLPSLYSPLGISLASKSLFILDLTKVFLT